MESGGRVLYVRRHIGWSILLFAGAVGTAVYALLQPSPDKHELGIALYYGVPLSIGAFLALLRAEVFAIDRAEGKLMVLRRQVLAPRRIIIDLSRVSVRRLTSGSDHYIWINVAGGRSFLFDSGRDPALIQAAMERLLADLRTG